MPLTVPGATGATGADGAQGIQGLTGLTGAVAAMRAGITSFAASIAPKTITFSTPMPNANYAVAALAINGVGVTFTIVPSTNSFTITPSIILTADVHWIAIAYQ